MLGLHCFGSIRTLLAIRNPTVGELKSVTPQSAVHDSSVLNPTLYERPLTLTLVRLVRFGCAWTPEVRTRIDLGSSSSKNHSSPGAEHCSTIFSYTLQHRQHLQPEPANPWRSSVKLDYYCVLCVSCHYYCPDNPSLPPSLIVHMLFMSLLDANVDRDMSRIYISSNPPMPSATP